MMNGQPARPIRLSADSVTDLPRELKERLSLATAPLYVNLREHSFRDGDIAPAEIFAAYEKEGLIPTTSAVPVGDYEAHFRRLSEGGACDVLHFCLSSGLSSCYQNACVACEAMDAAQVYVVDSESMSAGIALQLLHAEQLRGKGLCAAEIAAGCEAFKKTVRTTVLLESLTYMHKSGRCGSLSALGGNLLGLRPVLRMAGGELGVWKKLRGKSAARQYIDELLAKRGDIDRTAAFLYHTGAEEFDAIEAYVRGLNLFETLYTGPAGSIASAHIGSGCLTLMFAGAA